MSEGLSFCQPPRPNAATDLSIGNRPPRSHTDKEGEAAALHHPVRIASSGRNAEGTALLYEARRFYEESLDRERRLDKQRGIVITTAQTGDA
jgi:hypothetical protein